MIGSRVRDSVLLVGLVAFLSSCSTYHVVYPPSNYPEEIGGVGGEVLVKKGQSARVTLSDGEVKTGEVFSVSSESITLGKVGNHGFEESVIPISSIAKIEIEPTSSASSLILGGIGWVSFALAVILAVSLAGEGWPSS